ncbi:hypothetical protein ACFL43_06905 [Thermodesulfobacteriota bacterium]
MANKKSLCVIDGRALLCMQRPTARKTADRGITRLSASVSRKTKLRMHATIPVSFTGAAGTSQADCARAASHKKINGRWRLPAALSPKPKLPNNQRTYLFSIKQNVNGCPHKAEHNKPVGQ